MIFFENKPIYYFSSISHVVFIDGKTVDKYTATVFILYEYKRYAIRIFGDKENIEKYFNRLHIKGVFLKPLKKDNLEIYSPVLLKGFYK